VEFFTRSYHKGSAGLKWSCEGDIDYTVEKVEKEEPGTEWCCTPAEPARAAQRAEAAPAVKKYADFLSVPILLNAEQVNACKRPGRRRGGGRARRLRAEALGPLSPGPHPLRHNQGRSGRGAARVSGLLFVPMIPFE